MNQFEEIKSPAKIHSVWNGLDALKFLYKEDEYIEAPKPDLIVLDIHIPLRNGLEILSEITKHEELLDIPLVVLTSDTSQKVTLLKYNCLKYLFLTKPVDLSGHTKVVESIMKFWLSLKPQ